MSTQEQKTILLVEDDLINAMLTTKIIKSFGYNVITANTGEETIDIFKKTNAINLILMDIDLGCYFPQKMSVFWQRRLSVFS